MKAYVIQVGGVKTRLTQVGGVYENVCDISIYFSAIEK